MRESRVHPFWLILALILTTGLALRIFLARRRQTRLLSDLAVTRRLNFSAEDLIGVHDRYQGLQMIRQGHSRHAFNMIYGATEVGLVTLFCYTYERGFGIHRTHRQQWVAVVESGEIHDSWRAFPAPAQRARGRVSTGAVRNHGAIDRFEIHADREATLTRFTDPAVTAMFAAAPSDYEWEVHGPLAAVAAPLGQQTDTPGQLLSTVCDLARIIRQTSDATS